MRTRRPPRPLHPLLLGFGAVMFAACASAGTPSTAPMPSVAAPPSTSATPAPTQHAEATGVPATALLVGRTGQPGLTLIEARTGEVMMDVPRGAADPDWHRVVTATLEGARTTVSDEIVQPGMGGPRLGIDGAWTLPTIGDQPLQAGVSVDGSTIALVPAQGSERPGLSRFAIVSHVLIDRLTTAREADLRLERIVELPGAFDYDTLSPDGRILYVAQHLDAAPGAYQVRAVDVATGKLRDGVVVDKRNVDETMAGWPVAQLRRPDGLVLTLYRGADHPFVHALSSTDAWAICIDLPSSDASDATSARDWGLAPSADGRSVFAINGTLGIAAEIDPSELIVRRTSTLQTASRGGSGAAPVIVLAKFGHQAIGPAGRVIVSPDGLTVWAAGDDGVLAIGTRDLAVARRMLAGTAVDGVAVAVDGSVLFALTGDGGRIVALDPASGRELGIVPGDGFDRLFAAAPW